MCPKPRDGDDDGDIPHGLDRVKIPPGERTVSIPQGLLPFFAEDLPMKDSGTGGCQTSYQNWCRLISGFFGFREAVKKFSIRF